MADDNNIKHAFWRDDDHNNMMHGDADADNTRIITLCWRADNENNMLLAR